MFPRLRADAISQEVTVTALHQQVSSDDALHEASDTLQWNEATTAAEAAHFHTQCLESQVAELQQHVTAYNVLGQSNVTFRQRLAKISGHGRIGQTLRRVHV